MHWLYCRVESNIAMILYPFIYIFFIYDDESHLGNVLIISISRHC